MNILVTGANGYLGQGIVKQLINNGHKVNATDIELQNIDERAIKHKCDIFSMENPYEELGKPDCVLHLAWKDGFVHYSDSHIRELPNHIKFLEKMIKSGVKQVAVLGSMHEIGFYEGSINENTPCNPLSFYGIAKNALRQAIQIITSKDSITFQWLRGFYIVGNTEHGCSVFSKIALAEREGQKEFPFTMGVNQFDFLDYEEFCEQVVATVTQSDINGIINICSGRPEQLRHRAERFIFENNFNIKLQYGVFPDRPYDSKAVWGDNEKIQKILKVYNEKNGRVD